MISIKIECGCGQHYAFDVEPANGRMAAPVACPACGADGTAAANEAIAQTLAVPVAAPAAGAPVRVENAPSAVRLAAPVAAAATPARRPGLLPGQMDRTQAEHEAYAKVLWGDPRGEVVKFLMRQGLSASEAQELVEPWYRERSSTIRRNGVVKVVLGILMICAPVAFLVVSLMLGELMLMPFAVTVIVGFWGVYMVIKGICMFFAPKSQAGDVAEQ